MKLLYFMLLLLIPVIGMAQENIKVTVYEKEIRMDWDFDTSGTIMNWMVCYAQSEDTSGFRFHNFMEGAPYSDMWAWYVYVGPYNFATVWNKAFLFEEEGKTGYIKLGLLGQRFDSTWTTAWTYGPFPASTIGTPEEVMVQK